MIKRRRNEINIVLKQVDQVVDALQTAAMNNIPKEKLIKKMLNHLVIDKKFSTNKAKSIIRLAYNILNRRAGGGDLYNKEELNQIINIIFDPDPPMEKENEE